MFNLSKYNYKIIKNQTFFYLKFKLIMINFNLIEYKSDLKILKGLFEKF